MRLGAENGKGEVMVLEVETNSGKINQRLHAGLAKLLWVADTRSLKDERRAEGTAGSDDLLTGLDDSGLVLAWSQGLGGYHFDANGFVAFDDNLFDLVVAEQMKVLVGRASAVNVSMGRIRSAATTSR